MAVLLATVSAPALAQQRTTDPELEALIPDSAVTNPDAWAAQPTLPPQTAPTPVPNAPPPTTGPLDPSSPLDPLPTLDLPWPDIDQPMAIQPLTPEPGIDEANAALGATLPPAVQLASGPVPEENISRPFRGVAFAYPEGLDFADREGIEDRFQDLSNLEQLESKQDNPGIIRQRAEQDLQVLEKVFRNYGYFGVSIDLAATAEGEENANGEKVRFVIVPGRQFTFADITLGDLGQTGNGDSEMLRAAYPLQVGDAINGDRIIAAQGALSIALGDHGYAFAKVPDPTLTIDHSDHNGVLDQPVVTGGRYRFGEIVGSDDRFLSSRHIARNIARFDPGDMYDHSEIEDLRRALLATGLVSSVGITPRETKAPANGQDGTVALDVRFNRARARTVAGQIGYDSGEGFRLEASWENRNLFPPEGMLRFRGVAGTREQLIGSTFRKNNFGGRDLVMTLDLFGQTRDYDAYDARTVSFVATYERISNLLYQKRLLWSIGLQLIATGEKDKSTDGTGARRTYFIGAVPGSVGLDTTDNLLDAKRGYRVRLSLSPESSRINGGGQSFYVRSQIDASYYKAVSPGVILAGRVRAGSIFGAGIDLIAPSRRLYAGGGGSVRGFDFQGIGPKDTGGTPTGGRSLVEASVEARIETGLMGGAVSVVPFVDAGAVDTSSLPKVQDPRFGAGVGIRYNTGFGPIRIDVATPLGRRSGESPVGVYIALGQAF